MVEAKASVRNTSISLTRQALIQEEDIDIHKVRVFKFNAEGWQLEVWPFPDRAYPIIPVSSEEWKAI